MSKNSSRYGYEAKLSCPAPPPRRDKIDMTFRPHFIPAALNEAVDEIVRGLPDYERAQFLAMKVELQPVLEALAESLQENWNLSDPESPLALDLRKRGYFGHPAGISFLIIMEVEKALGISN